MFDIKQATNEGRIALNLHSRGRLNQEDQDALTSYVKKTFVDNLVANGVISKEIGKIAHKASFPVNDTHHVSREKSLAKAKISKQKYQAGGGMAIEKLLNLEFHEGVLEWEFVVDEPVAVAARADGLETRGRKPGTKNRDKAVIEADKAAKAIRSEARKALGLPPRGRLSKEQMADLDEYIAKNSN